MSHYSAEIVGSRRIVNAIIKFAMVLIVACGFSILLSQNSYAVAPPFTLSGTCSAASSKVYDGNTSATVTVSPTLSPSPGDGTYLSLIHI